MLDLFPLAEGRPIIGADLGGTRSWSAAAAISGRLAESRVGRFRLGSRVCLSKRPRIK